MLTDEQLVQAMARGDQAAFEAFVHRYHGPLLGYLERTLQDARKAEDLVQEVFLRLIRQLRNGRPPDPVRPWLYKVALNLCRDYWKSPGYRTGSHLVEEPPERMDSEPSVSEIYERQETRKELLETLDELPEVQRHIIVLRFYQELKLQEIAAALEIPLSSIKTHLYTGLKKLQKRLLGRPKESLKERKEPPHARTDR
ncbi:RNA polymerase sigma factor [Paenibacillus aurantius]|uniref:RNA polymerase sigma factor n=1 Tax=Paenibacillus aurantius TaxID=2918900 RepID=A0AA96LC04_9BACL|nr:RNA polymerase sigma factor [Paenibacillus aurantius]WNQ11169.1 RNA polymerase sigma factor [Paenibacillus aurantius]